MPDDPAPPSPAVSSLDGKQQIEQLSKEREAALAALETCDVDDAASTVDAKRQLEKLQVQTIFSLVEHVELDGRSCKLLFLSNKQAGELDVSREKLMQALDNPPQSNLLINLISSVHSALEMDSCSMKPWHEKDEAKEIASFSETGGRKGLEALERRIALFLQQCVLPVAVSTRAIVFTYRDCCCVLQSVFARLCEAEALKNHGVLPFTVVNVGTAESLYLASKTPGSVAAQLLEGSKRWKSSLRLVKEASRHRGLFECERVSAKADAPRGCTHYIICDSAWTDHTGYVYSTPAPSQELSNKLVETFATALPSIAFSTMNMRWGWYDWSTVEAFASYVGRGLPCVLIDSRPQPEGGEPQTVAQAMKALDDVEEALNKDGRVNAYLASTLACLHSALRRELHSNNRDGNGAARGASIAQVLHAQEAQRRDGDVVESKASGGQSGEGEGGLGTKTPVDNQSRLISEICEYLTGLGQRIEASGAQIEQDKEKKRLDAFLAGAKDKKTVRDLDAYLKKMSANWFGLFYRDRTRHLVEAHGSLFAPYPWPEAGDNKGEWCIVLGLSKGVLDSVVGTQSETLVSVCDALSAAAEVWLSNIFEARKPKLSGITAEMPNTVFIALSEFLASDVLFSVNLDDRPKLSRVINKVARIDRLPPENSFEAMQIVQRAWELVDIYMHVARRCKWLAKCIYALLLLNGMAITIITTLWVNLDLDECAEAAAAVDPNATAGLATEACAAPPLPLNTLISSCSRSQARRFRVCSPSSTRPPSGTRCALPRSRSSRRYGSSARARSSIRSRGARPSPARARASPSGCCAR